MIRMRITTVISTGVLVFLGPAFLLCHRATPPARDSGADVSCASAGDVIFFRTTTWRGRLVRVLQTDDDHFTHVGIIMNDAPGVRVAHACPVAPAIVQIDRLSDLLAREEITGFAIYHPRATASDARNALSIANDYVTRKTPFDSEFDLADDRAVYCTELIWLAYRAAGLKVRKSRGILFPADLLQSGFFEGPA